MSKGKIPWNKDTHIQTNTGRTHFKKGNIPWNKNKKLSKKIRKKLSLAHKGQFQPKGKDSPSWKGGRWKNVDGYIEVYCPNHPNPIREYYIREHRLIMEKSLGRYLTRKEVVHHKNDIRDDNRIENLKLFKNRSEHQKFHRKMRGEKYDRKYITDCGD